MVMSASARMDSHLLDYQAENHLDVHVMVMKDYSSIADIYMHKSICVISIIACDPRSNAIRDVGEIIVYSHDELFTKPGFL